MEDASETTRNAIAMLHPKVVVLVKQCLLNDSLNTQGCIMEVKRPRASSLDYQNSGCDRFTLEIPFCGTLIPWEVIFDQNQVEEPPDVVFSPRDEYSNFSPSLDCIPCLSQWNVEDECSLSNLLKGLLEEYRRHHRDKLTQYSRLNIELSSMLEAGDYSNVDVHCSYSSSEHSAKNTVVRFFIPLQLNAVTIPAYFTKENPGPDKAALVIQFSSPSAVKPITTLHISPRIERMLGGSDQLHLPQWGGDKGSMKTYVPAVHRLLQERVEAISLSYVERKEYTAACLSIMGSAVLEYDTEHFKMMAFLFDVQGFSLISCLTMTDLFPNEQPTLTLQSIYHRYCGVPCMSIIKDYPYSPRWNADEMAERLRTYVISIALQFMGVSQEKGESL